MRIFICHAKEDSGFATQLALRLKGERHTVFFDASSLQDGAAYDARIRNEIERADVFIFLITPESVQLHRYTITELRVAQAQWEHPEDHVLPVMLKRTAMERVPEYLRAITILKLTGDPVADIAHGVAQIGKRRRWWPWVKKAGAVAAGLVGATAAAGAVVVVTRKLMPKSQHTPPTTAPSKKSPSRSRKS